MDATNNRALIGLSIGPSFGIGGFQFLNLNTNSFGLPFPSMDPMNKISEDPLIDPIRNLLLSATESNNYELIDVAAVPSPNPFYERSIPNSFVEADSSGEDCSTGLALAPYEFTDPSQVFAADLTTAIFSCSERLCISPSLPLARMADSDSIFG